MKAYQIGPQTGLASLTATNRPDPVPGAGEAVLKVRLVALNNRDLQVLEGRYGAKKPDERIPGSEGVGVFVTLDKYLQFFHQDQYQVVGQLDFQQVSGKLLFRKRQLLQES